MIDKINTTFARAPARLGLGGGGSDIPDYFNKFGGAVLNATINQYVYCQVQDTPNQTTCVSIDKNLFESSCSTDNKLSLHWATLSHFQKFFQDELSGIKIQTYTDIPEGSGLGTSSALVVVMVKALSKHFDLKLSDADIIRISYEIERIDCALAGGFQDYVSAVFGGFNFIDFYETNNYLCSPLSLSNNIISKFENQSLLIFTGLSRSSSAIIKDQQEAISEASRLQSMHDVKATALLLRDALNNSDFEKFRKIFQKSWLSKKGTSKSMVNNDLLSIEENLYLNGAESVKLSGAGGGGFFLALSSEDKMLSLKKFVANNYNYINVSFTPEGVQAWTI